MVPPRRVGRWLAVAAARHPRDCGRLAAFGIVRPVAGQQANRSADYFDIRRRRARRAAAGLRAECGDAFGARSSAARARSAGCARGRPADGHSEVAGASR